MAVWGIGAYYPGEKVDKAKKYVENGTVIIGYFEKQRPKYYEMLRKIKAGDVIFIKSRFMLNQPMKVKAIGIAISNHVSIENGMDGRIGVRVKWIKDFTDCPKEIIKERTNDGSTRTIYEEKNENVIRCLAGLLL